MMSKEGVGVFNATTWGPGAGARSNLGECHRPAWQVDCGWLVSHANATLTLVLVSAYLRLRALHILTPSAMKKAARRERFLNSGNGQRSARHRMSPSDTPLVFVYEEA